MRWRRPDRVGMNAVAVTGVRGKADARDGGQALQNGGVKPPLQRRLLAVPAAGKLEAAGWKPAVRENRSRPEKGTATKDEKSWALRSSGQTEARPLRKRAEKQMPATVGKRCKTAA